MTTTPNLDKILAARHQNADATAQTAEEFLERALWAEDLAANLLNALKPLAQWLGILHFQGKQVGNLDMALVDKAIAAVRIVDPGIDDHIQSACQGFKAEWGS
jgi:hypothetical protein